MDRLKRSNEGFTLLELVIAMALAAVVLLSASNLLINFGKFNSNVVKSEASLMETALGSFEEIVGRILAANKVAINKTPTPDAALTSYPAGCAADSSCIQIRVDRAVPTTSSDYTDDTVYTYWKSGTQLKYTIKVGTGAASTASVLNNDITSLSFVRDATYSNKIAITLEAQAASGPVSQTSKEHLETTVVMRSGGAS